MREVAVQFWDDLVISETGKKNVPAMITVTIGLDGEWLCELDLSAESHELLREDVLVPLGIEVTDAAQRLGMSRTALSRVINGHAGIGERAPQSSLFNVKG